jgi:hypothetical protein
LKPWNWCPTQSEIRLTAADLPVEAVTRAEAVAIRVGVVTTQAEAAGIQEALGILAMEDILAAEDTPITVADIQVMDILVEEVTLVVMAVADIQGVVGILSTTATTSKSSLSFAFR